MAKKPKKDPTEFSSAKIISRAVFAADHNLDTAGIDAAMAWQDKNWKHGITRSGLVLGIIAAYLGAANAKR